MPFIRVAVLVFDKGYHVGWREPKRIVDHTTILRALIYTAYLTGSERCAELVIRGELEASALLPTTTVGKELRLLAPFPKIPCLGKAARIRGSFITLSTLKQVMDFVTKCASEKGVPIVQEVQIDRIAINCTTSSAVKPLELKRVKGVVCVDGECSEIAPHIPEELFTFVTEYRNRIDRLSGSADVYEVYGVKPFTPLWLAFRGSEEAIKCSLNLLEALQKFGIGGLRSRGWGRFRLELDLTIRSEDLEVLTKFSGWVQGYNYTLGFMTPGKWMDSVSSYATREVVIGRSGPSINEYRLPLVYVMDIGSVVYAKDIPKPHALHIDDGRAVLLFNPVVIHA